MSLVSEGDIALANADGTDARQIVEGYAPVWSPDGRRFAFVYDVNSDAIPILVVADLTGTFPWSDGVEGAFPTWSPDSTRIAVQVAVPGPTVQVLDAASGEMLWEIDGQHPDW